MSYKLQPQNSVLAASTAIIRRFNANTSGQNSAVPALRQYTLIAGSRPVSGLAAGDVARVGCVRTSMKAGPDPAHCHLPLRGQRRTLTELPSFTLCAIIR